MQIVHSFEVKEKYQSFIVREYIENIAQYMHSIEKYYNCSSVR